MNSIWQILTHTPWWVFVLFFYLLKVGIDATKPRIMTIRKLYILPAIFLEISIQSLFSFFPRTMLILSIYIMSLTIGIIIGWILTRKLKLKFDHTHHLIKIPGSFMTLILTMSIFFAKYYLGYSIATNPEILDKTGFVIFQLIFSGVSTGLLLGRAACYIFRNNRSSHENLSELKINETA